MLRVPLSVDAVQYKNSSHLSGGTGQKKHTRLLRRLAVKDQVISDGLIAEPGIPLSQHDAVLYHSQLRKA